MHNTHADNAPFQLITFMDGGGYRAIPEHIVLQHRLLLNFCKEHSVEVGAAATQFSLPHDLVKSVIPGPKTRKELERLITVTNHGPK